MGQYPQAKMDVSNIPEDSMNDKFDRFRKEVQAEFELTQGLLRVTVANQEAQGEGLTQHEELLRQQWELVRQLAKHQLEGIQDFRRLEKGLGRIATSLDGALDALEDTPTRAELEAFERRVAALEKREDAA
jgi:hypothetical protein